TGPATPAASSSRAKIVTGQAESRFKGVARRPDQPAWTRGRLDTGSITRGRLTGSPVSRRVSCPRPPPDPRHEHRHLPPVLLVSSPERGPQIPLLQTDADE